MEHLSKIDQHVITDKNQWSFYDLIKFSVQKGQYTPIRPLLDYNVQLMHNNVT